MPQSIGLRLLAYLIDLAIIMGAWILANLVIAAIVVGRIADPGSIPANKQDQISLITTLTMGCAAFLYFFLLEGSIGKTAGKAVLGLSVVRAADPWRTTWGGAFLRTLLRPIDFVFFGLPGIALIGATARRQRLGDMAGRTLVVKRRPWNEVPWQFAPAYPGLMACPLCRGPIWVGMTVCNHCGAYWVPDDPSREAPSAPTEPAPEPATAPAAPAPEPAAAPDADPAPARDVLLALLDDDDGWTRCLAARELVALDPADLDTAGVALASCDPLARLRLVDLLTRQPGPPSEPLLALLAGDRNGEVAVQAEGALRVVRSRTQAAWAGPAAAPAPPTPPS